LWLGLRQIRHVAQHRHQVPAPFAHTIDAAAHDKAARYTLAKTRLGLVEVVWGTALLLAWTLLGGLDALITALRDLSGWHGLGLQLAVLALFGVCSSLLEVPLSWYQTFRIEAAFGFNRQTLQSWLTDGLKGAAVGALIGLPLAALVLWLMAQAGSAWWLWAWGVFMGFNLLMLVVYPTVIAPLFNRFTPLQDDGLRQRVQALAQRCGFAITELFVMDGSRRSAHANAYFTGLGKSKRVVFFDTLLTMLTPGEVEAVLAHELGHHHHHHVGQRVLGMAVLSGVAFAVLGWLSNSPWFYQGLGVEPVLTDGNQAAALILFAMTTPLLSFWFSPLLAARSRRQEFEADDFARQHANAADLVSALTKLYRDNASTLTPDPVYVRFYHSHPPALERVGRLQATPV
jgi:STE24 endopeptidase